LEFIMDISSVSLTYFSMVSTPSASAPVRDVAPAANDHAVAKKERSEGHEPRRRNVLFDAMMSALREMGLGKPSAQGGSTASSAAPAAGANPASSPAPSQAAAPATDAAAATTPAPSLEDAVLSFANALWQALRGDEGSRHRRGRDDDGDDHRHHHHHHHHGHRHGRDYAGLASRVEALAVRIETRAPAAAPAVTAPAVKSPKLPGTDPVPMDAAAPAKVVSAATPVAVTPVDSKTTPPAPTTAPVKGSLVESFAAMLKTLRGGDQPAGTAGPESSLAAFLHSLARGLDTDRSAPSMSVVGVMINVSA
jgi:hypothetical protein